MVKLGQTKYETYDNYNWLLEWGAVGYKTCRKYYRTKWFAKRKMKKLQKDNYCVQLWWVGFTPLR